MKIGFIGAGKAGRALGLYLKAHDLDVFGYYSKTYDSAEKAAHLTGTKAFDTMEALVDACKIIFITTPDQALADIDRQISAYLNEKAVPSQKIFIHVSGAYAADCLVGIKTAGCPVGSMHPLQSFGEASGSAKQLETTHFCIEGTPKAMEVMHAILKKTGGRYDHILPRHKPLYHAGACVISNFLVTLLDSGMRYMEGAGIKKENLYAAIEPLIISTLRNIREKGPQDALTGPIVRGDFDTLQLHLKAIEKDLPSQLALYRTMAQKTVMMAGEKRLTKEQTVRFRELMKGIRNDEQ